MCHETGYFFSKFFSKEQGIFFSSVKQRGIFLVIQRDQISFLVFPQRKGVCLAVLPTKWVFFQFFSYI